VINVKNDQRAIREAQKAMRQRQRPGLARSVWEGLLWGLFFSLGIVTFFGSAALTFWWLLK